MATRKLPTLPTELFVVREPVVGAPVLDDDAYYFNASDKLRDHAEIGEAVEVGVYALVRMVTVRADVQIDVVPKKK